MSRLLEILGEAISCDTAKLIWHWLDTVKQSGQNVQDECISEIIDLVSVSKLDVAEEQLKAYLFENPSSTKGRMAAAAMSIEDGRIAAAIEQLNSVYLREPSNTMALYSLGHCYERLGKESQAIEFYQDCLKFKNFLQLPRQRLAAIYFKNGQFEKTIQEYEFLKEEYPGDMSILVILGFLYISNARYDEAVESFNSAILVHPDNFENHHKDIVQLIGEGRVHEALEQVDELLNQQADRPDLILTKGDILAILGDVEGSICQYEQAIHICPNFLEASIKLGTQYLLLRKEHLAAKIFNKAAEINDQIVEAYIGLSIAQKLALNSDQAIETLALAAAIQPNSSLLFAQAATWCFRSEMGHSLTSGCQDQAGDDMEGIIKAHIHQLAVQPQNPELHYRMGILLTAVGRMSDAAKEFDIAIQINPQFFRARSKLAICLFETGRKKAALKILSKPDSLDSNTLDLHYKVGLLYCDRFRFASSLINLQHYVEQTLATTCPTVNVSIVLQNLGLLDRATAIWENLSETADFTINSTNLFS